MALISHRPRVFLELDISGQPIGRLTIELFTDKTPKACENFRQFCTGEYNGLTYTSVPFHRVIDEFMIQGGDVANGDGTGTTSIYEGEFEDEALDWREMDSANLVCAANRGPNTNGSQFFITLEPCSHLNGKHTIFGRLVSGEETLQRIAKVAVDKNDRPIEPVLISRCGELERRLKQRKLDSPVSTRIENLPTERGRRRKSGDSDEEMENGTPTSIQRRSRRQSDNIVDEGIRGRPRLRPGSRSRSPAIEDDDEEEEEEADVDQDLSDRRSTSREQGRKRNLSPSRRASSRERRRRSLPNQYAERVDRGYGEDYRYRPHARKDSYRDRRRRFDDYYRPSRDRYLDDSRLDGDGRLGAGSAGSSFDDYDPPVKFKGRGVMKYQEVQRQW